MRKRKFNLMYLDLYMMFASIVAFTVAKGIDAFQPKGWVQPSGKVEFVAMATGVLSALWYFVKRFERLELYSEHPTVAPSFGDGFDVWLEPYPYSSRIHDLVICAYTSHTFQSQFWARSGLKLGRVRILLFFEPGGPTDVPGKLDNRSVAPEQTISEWGLMKTDHRIEQLEIRKRSTNASLFFGIANGERMVRGLLWPRVGLGALQPGKVWVYTQESKSMRSIIQEHQEWFERMWEDSEVVLPVPPSKNVEGNVLLSQRLDTPALQDKANP